MRKNLLSLMFAFSLLLLYVAVFRGVYERSFIAEMTEKQRIINIENENLILKEKVERLEKAKKKGMTLSVRLAYPLKDFDARLTQGYGQNLLAYGGMGLHGHIGLDYATPEGTPVYAAHDGIVFESWEDDTNSRVGYGGRVKLRYRKGSQGGETVYAHLSRSVVAVGDFVEEGQIIGYTGNTGFSTRPHLHFGLRFLWYCDKGGTQVGKPCEVLNGDNGMLGWVDPIPFIKG